VRHSVRFVAETDSLNSSILGPDAGPGTPEFSLFVQEVAREMTVKAGQKCTAIRKALVPKAMLGEVVAALSAKLAETVVGDPRAAGVGMGPLASLAQRDEVLSRVADLERESERVAGDADGFEPTGGDSRQGAFLRPILLLCRDAAKARAVHSVEAFGPVSTVIGYDGTRDAIALARRGEGSLAGSVFTADESVAAELVLGLAPYHGRVLVVNRHCAKESTGPARRSRRSCMAVPAAPAEARSSAASVACCTTCSARPCRAVPTPSLRSAGAGRGGAPSETRESTRSARRSTRSSSATPSTPPSAR
jgi:oxepin-CoA hydrolase/3-oxo-5,6-dehydrosuberyl-CoA semialdehyde dehydrogenase